MILKIPQEAIQFVAQLCHKRSQKHNKGWHHFIGNVHYVLAKQVSKEFAAVACTILDDKRQYCTMYHCVCLKSRTLNTLCKDAMEHFVQNRCHFHMNDIYFKTLQVFITHS